MAQPQSKAENISSVPALLLSVQDEYSAVRPSWMFVMPCHQLGLSRIVESLRGSCQDGGSRTCCKVLTTFASLLFYSHGHDDCA